MKERDELMEELAVYLDRLSERTGDILTEYDWRQLCSFRVALEDRFKINVDELRNSERREDSEGVYRVAPGTDEY